MPRVDAAVAALQRRLERALERELRRQMFENRFKNFTNRLDDTSLLRKARRDVARVKTLLTQRAKKA